MQLVAYGAQDIYLTGNPQITFFKVVYRRHTNFSMESVQQTINGSVGTGQSSVSATISRNGDLVGQLLLEVTLPSVTTLTAATHSNWTNNTGHAYLKECSVEIGGQEIDKHTSEWLDIYNELTDHDESEWIGLNKHAAKNAYLKSNASITVPNNLKLYVPLKFWFCRNPGLALPLIALQYHEVKVKMTLRAKAALVNCDQTGTAATAGTAPTTKLWADYYYLDTDERRRFAQVSHEYLIEQIQFENKSGGKMELNFNHPVKELIWAGTRRTSLTDNFSFTLYDRNAIGSTYQLKLNGHDRFKERDSKYFSRTQVWQHHTGNGESHSTSTLDNIAVYSFALKPEEHQPSGTCNFSRIDNALLVETGGTTSVNVYAVNYNVLRIMSGMGGLAYSN